MIPGTKARAQPGQQKIEEAQALTAEQTALQLQKSLDAIQEPSARHYSRRAILTQAPMFFKEALSKLLRTSNHLERKLSESDK
jgi:hypothetical protein